MPSIPEEIYTEILVRLRVPAKSIIICKCVCKTWFTLISDPGFVRVHLNRKNNPKLMLKSYDFINRTYIYKSITYDSLSSKDVAVAAVEMNYPFKSLVGFYHDVKSVASCDGLVVCLFKYHNGYHFLCIWNPVTREYKTVPASPRTSWGDQTIYMYDFCYDCKTDDYKLVQIARFIEDEHSSLEIYTLRSNSWKRIQTIPCDIEDPIVSGVIVNGALHWPSKMFGKERLIISMEISNENFKQLQLPKEHSENSHFFTDIGVLEGHHCAFVGGGVKVHVELWVLMQDYGVRDSWTKQYVITREEIAKAY